MPKISKKKRIITAAVSTSISMGVIISAFMLWPDRLIDFLWGCTLIILVPTAILDHINQGWLNAINDRLPLLVKDISDSQQSGITIIRALEEAAKKKGLFGPLSEEVGKLTVQMSWGLSFESALRKFADRIDTPIVRRFCALVLEASLSGGRIGEVFTTTSEFMEEMRAMDREMSTQMHPYLIIIYAAFFVFLFTSIILLRSFFAPLELFPGGAGFAITVTTPIYRTFFFHTMLIQALLGGLMAGKIGEGRVLSGLKHSIVMLTAGYAAFVIVIP